MLQGGYTALFEVDDYGVEVSLPPEHGLMSEASAQKVRAPSYSFQSIHFLVRRNKIDAISHGCLKVSHSGN
jgi:hypothetical protein